MLQPADRCCRCSCTSYLAPHRRTRIRSSRPVSTQTGPDLGHRNPGRAASRRHSPPCAAPQVCKHRRLPAGARPSPPKPHRHHGRSRRSPASCNHGVGKDKPPPPAPPGPRPATSADGGDEERGRRGIEREETRGRALPRRGVGDARERKGSRSRLTALLSNQYIKLSF